jgi:uncharacterized protein
MSSQFPAGAQEFSHEEDSSAPATNGRHRWSERRLASSPAEVRLRSRFFTVEPPIVVHPQGYPWEHELRVALPFSYAHRERQYPVLWVLDNDLETALAVLTRHEVIVVSVGTPALSWREWGVRRLYDFTPTVDSAFCGPGAEYIRRELAQSRPELLREGSTGGASHFLEFLIGQARPLLASRYRMDPADQGLLGFSQGGTLVGYALFARPGAFARYICGSPVLNSCNFYIFQQEEEYAADHDDLPASVFFGAGEREMTDYGVSGIVSSMARMAETLFIRGYPSLKLEARVFPGESHDTVLPLVLRWGVRSVWGDKLAPID